MTFLLYSPWTDLGTGQTWVQVPTLPISSYLTLGQLPHSLHLSFESAEWEYNTYPEGLL